MAELVDGRTGQLSTRFRPIPQAPPGPPVVAGPGPGPVTLGLWLGLVTGLVEVALEAGGRSLLGRITPDTLNTTHHYAWMTPACNLALLGAAGILLRLGLALRDGPRPRRLARFALIFLATYALCLSIPKIHGTATLALALGAAWRLSRWVERHAEGFARVFRRSLGPVIAVGGAAIAGGFVERTGAEARALAALPAPRGGSPNVVLIVLDTMRADALSRAGSTRDATPNLARLAARGVRFDAARSPAPWTLPAHASLFTGRWPHEHSANVGHPLDSRDPTIAEGLASRGYATAAFVANTHNGNAWYGLDRGFSRYEDLYENRMVSPVEALRSARLGHKILMSRLGLKLVRLIAEVPKYHYRKTAAMINRDALAWLDARGDRPFFLFLNYYDVHDPYTVPAGAPRPFARAAEGRPRSAMEAARDDYDDCLLYLDDQVGKLLAELERRDALDNTLIVVTSDHGEGFGEHGLQGHGISLYRPEVHVPLIVVQPRSVPAGRTVANPVSLRDIPATIADLAGAALPFPGRSLTRYWREADRGERELDEPVISVVDRSAKISPLLTNAPARLGPMMSLAMDGLILIRRGDGREELYDLVADPDEAQDLSASPAYGRDLERLRAELNRTQAGAL